MVSLFTLTQTFPKDLKPPSYRDPATRKVLGRTEIERREHYIQPMQEALGDTHSLVKLTLDCLEYDPEDRPSAMEVLGQLENVGRIIPQNCTETKLELIQQISGKNEEIEQNRVEHQRQLSEKDAQIQQIQRQLIEVQEQLKEKDAHIGHLQAANDQLKAAVDRLQANC